MRFQNVSHKTLKTVAARPVLASPCHLRPRPNLCRPLLASSSPLVAQCRHQSSYPERIAIFGGGIGGLSSAYFISKAFPQSKITLFEAGKETGGWIKSRRVEVVGQDGKRGNVLFEMGPRTLRNATVTAGLVRYTCTHGNHCADPLCRFKSSASLTTSHTPSVASLARRTASSTTPIDSTASPLSAPRLPTFSRYGRQVY